MSSRWFGRRHSRLTGDDIGTVIWKEVDDAAARLALSLSEDKEGRIVKQADDGSHWILDDYSGPTWRELTSVGVAAVTSVAGRTGDVVLTTADVTDAGTAATEDVGTGAGDVVQLDGTGALPAVSGANLTDLPTGGSDITVEDGGTPLTTAVKKFNFEGGGVTLSEPVADEITVTVGAGSAPVASVFARTGTVTAQASDYDASQIDNDSGVPGAFVDDALNQLDTEVTAAQADATQALADAAAAQSDATDAKTKTDRITVTQAVNLDTMEADTAANNAKITYDDAATVAANAAHVASDGSADHGLGTAAYVDTGATIGDAVALENVGGGPGLPAVDGSQLLNLPTGTGGDVAVEDAGVPVTAAVRKLNFAGGGVTITEPVADEVTITVGAGSAPVDSVHGRTGAVVSAPGDYTSNEVDNDSTVSGGAGSVTTALDQLSSDITAKTVDVVSNVASGVILGRDTAGSGDSEELTPTETRALLALGTAAQADTGNQDAGDVPALTAEGTLPITDVAGNTATHFSDSYYIQLASGRIGGLYGDSAQWTAPGGILYGIYEDELDFGDGTSFTQFRINGITSTSPTFTILGRDYAADGTKLDGIEAGADVTDTANVTAAGALMDSEVDADIKTLALPANTTISAYGATLTDDADAAAARTTLELGTAAVANIGTGAGDAAEGDHTHPTLPTADEKAALNTTEPPSAANKYLTEDSIGSVYSQLNPLLDDGPLASILAGDTATFGATPASSVAADSYFVDTEAGLIYHSDGVSTWTGVGGGGGETNLGANVGAGADIFRDKVGATLNFRGINPASAKITAVVNADNIDIDANITAADVGLGNVDNTADADKPVSTAQAAADTAAQAAAEATAQAALDAHDVANEHIDWTAPGAGTIHESNVAFPLKSPVRAATVVAGDFANAFENGDLVDGVTLATGDRLLIKDGGHFPIGTYTYDDTGGIPNANGEAQPDNNDSGLVTTLSLHVNNAAGSSNAATFGNLNIGDVLTLLWQEYQIDSITDNTTYWTFDVTPLPSTSTTFPVTQASKLTQYVYNGIYDVQASGAPVRASDFDTGESVASSYVVVEEGQANENKILLCTNNGGSDTVGTDSIAFVGRTQASYSSGFGGFRPSSESPGSNADNGHFNPGSSLAVANAETVGIRFSGKTFGRGWGYGSGSPLKVQSILALSGGPGAHLILRQQDNPDNIAVFRINATPEMINPGGLNDDTFFEDLTILGTTFEKYETGKIYETTVIPQSPSMTFSGSGVFSLSGVTNFGGKWQYVNGTSTQNWIWNDAAYGTGELTTSTNGHTGIVMPSDGAVLNFYMQVYPLSGTSLTWRSQLMRMRPDEGASTVTNTMMTTGPDSGNPTTGGGDMGELNCTVDGTGSALLANTTFQRGDKLIFSFEELVNAGAVGGVRLEWSIRVALFEPVPVGEAPGDGV